MNISSVMSVAMSAVPWRRSHRNWLALLLGTLSCLTILFISPAQAVDVQILPANPQLGDTIAVHVWANRPMTTAPTVVVGDRTYPVFPMEQGHFRALVPTTPLDAPGRRVVQVVAEDEVRNLAVALRDRNFPTQSIWLPPDRAGIEGTDYEFDRVDAFKQILTPEKFWNGPFLRPSQGSVSTVYGVRRYYNGEFAEDYYHRGVDYAASTGSPVVAPAAGRIVLVGREADGFHLHGNTIGIDHGQGVASIFIHLSRIDVREGEFVQAGQTVGGVGSTGASTGPHLHWGLYVHGMAVDPVPWRYDGVD
jgi:murein DD-endopeptidase MepM/ murein hydrolase activator NlpD